MRNFMRFLMWLLGVIITVGCIYFIYHSYWNKSARLAKQAGVALSFDDRFIEEWYRLRPLFKKYNARATFYITQFDSLTTQEKLLLKELAEDGHEIACHGAIHTNAIQFVEARGEADYINNEVKPALQAMAKEGYKPSSFAYPGGARNKETDQILLRHFTTLRDVTKIERKIMGIPLRRPMALMIESFYQYEQDPLFYALSIDNGDGLLETDIQQGIEKAYNDHSVLILFGHQPFFHNQPPNSYGFNIETLSLILKEAKRKNLRFYTMSELLQR